MTYRGIVSNGVVVLEGEKPVEGTHAEVRPVHDASAGFSDLISHPAIGMWKDRNDLPDDPVKASSELPQRLMRRADE